MTTIKLGTYADGIYIIKQHFGQKKYFWNILAQWSQLWHPNVPNFDKIVIKNDKDKIIMECHGENSTTYEIEKSKGKQIVRIYPIGESWLLSACLVGGSKYVSPDDFIKKVVTNYNNYYHTLLEPTLDWYRYVIF